MDRDLFVCSNITQGKKQNMPMQLSHVSIVVTGMLDLLWAVPAARAVQTEAPVDVADAQVPAPAGPLSRLLI